MENEIKLNHALMLKKQKMLEKSIPRCKENNAPCVFFDPANRAMSEHGFIDALNLCPLNRYSKTLEDIIKNIFIVPHDTIEKGLFFSYQEAVYSAISMVEEEIVLSLENKSFECSDIHKHAENINRSMKKLSKLFGEDFKEAAYSCRIL